VCYLNIISKLKKAFIARPGKRFYLLHRYSQKKLTSPIILLVLLFIACLALVPGLIMLFTPGPGLLFIGLFLLPFIALSKKFAHLLDKFEMVLRVKVKKIKNRIFKSNNKK
jgi:predicted membrane protein